MAKEKDRIYWASELALKNVIKDGLDDIFVTGRTKHWSNIIEQELLQHPKLQQTLLARVREDLLQALNNQKSERPECLVDFQKYQTPKRSGLYAYRHAALLEPKTTLGYNTLAILFAEVLEPQRMPQSENVVFSYRYSPNMTSGKLFADGTETGFKGFRREELRQSAIKGNNFILMADIAHFYDTLNLHVLENQLRKSAGEDRFLGERVTYWLDRFLQKTDTGWSKGIPVGNNGSRILAEGFLIGLDRRLKRKNINFIRYVDDFRIFTETPAEAQKALEILNFELDRIGLALNDNKLALIKISEAFREKGNAIISGEDVSLEHTEYQELIPMVFRRSRNSLSSDEEYGVKISEVLARYEAGSPISDVAEVTLLARHCLQSTDLQDQLKIIPLFERHLSFAKYICRGMLKAENSESLQVELFGWFISNIKNLPSHAVHAIFEMFSDNLENRKKVVSEILFNDSHLSHLDPFVFREAFIAFRTSLDADDIEDLLQVITKNNNSWTIRGIAYCIWRGKQFSQKEKHARLGKLAANYQDEFIQFLSKIRYADFKTG